MLKACAVGESFRIESLNKCDGFDDASLNVEVVG